MINLYIDHQNVAPLIYSLEDILDKAVEQSHNASSLLFTQSTNMSSGVLFMKPSQTSSMPSTLKAKKVSNQTKEL